MTSSPGTRRRSPNFGDVSAETASRLADDPEFTSKHSRMPVQRANSFSKRSREAAGGQPEIERGIHQRAHFGGVEDFARYRHAALAGNELALREGFRAVLTYELQDHCPDEFGSRGHATNSRYHGMVRSIP